MSYIKTDLKIFELKDCGEIFYIVANDEKSALEYWKNEIIYDDKVDIKAIEITEVLTSNKVKIRIDKDKWLYNTVNKYKIESEYEDSIDIWKFMKWKLIKNELQGVETNIPFYIAGSLC